MDFYGLTDRGKVRPTNEDHFLFCQLKKQMQILATSLPDAESISIGEERLAAFGMVADGVGGGAGGAEASRLAVEALTRYVSESIHTYYTADTTHRDQFAEALRKSALKAHQHLLKQAEANPALQGMATTLTLAIGVWPMLYVVQVGDSRYYLLRGDELTQISRDQTVGQELVDSGAIDEVTASKLKWSSTLSSSIGGSESHPVVTPVRNDWGYVHLLCSDGLTKHVSDEQIRRRLMEMTSAQDACEKLVADALEDGGTDNVTVIVVKGTRKDDD
jgi:protein phosphatase